MYLELDPSRLRTGLWLYIQRPVFPQTSEMKFKVTVGPQTPRSDLL